MQRNAVPRKQRQRGHALTETALIVVPFFALILGTLDFSLALFVRSTLQHAVREGARYAVTFQTESGLGHDASIKHAVSTHAMGLLAGDEAQGKIQIRYYSPDSLEETAGNWPGNIVEISVEDYEWKWLASLLYAADPLHLTLRSSDRMEGLGGGSSPPAR